MKSIKFPAVFAEDDGLILTSDDYRFKRWSLSFCTDGVKLFFPGIVRGAVDIYLSHKKPNGGSYIEVKWIDNDDWFHLSDVFKIRSSSRKQYRNVYIMHAVREELYNEGIVQPGDKFYVWLKQ